MEESRHLRTLIFGILTRIALQCQVSRKFSCRYIAFIIVKRDLPIILLFKAIIGHVIIGLFRGLEIRHWVFRKLFHCPQFECNIDVKCNAEDGKKPTPRFMFMGHSLAKHSEFGCSDGPLKCRNADFRASKRSRQNDESSAALLSTHIKPCPPEESARRSVTRWQVGQSGNDRGVSQKVTVNGYQIWISQSFSSSQSSSDGADDEIPISPQAK
jgi:hypothetical protein